MNPPRTSSEIAALTLDDVDWRVGEVVIRGKGSRIDRLPLSADVGEALADYLCGGRPRGFGRLLFLNGPLRSRAFRGTP